MATRQDPWANDPIVTRPPRATEGAANVTLSDGRKLVRRPDGTMYEVASSSYTNETPTQLLNQGYMPDENGIYAKTIGTQEIPWANDPIAPTLPPLQSGQAEAYSSSATEQLPFLDEAAAWTAGVITGTPYNEVRALQGDLRNYDRQNYGAARNAGGVSGFAAGLAAPGGAGGSVIKAGALGGGYGALYGLGAGEGSLADRAPGGAVGAIGGAVGGAALQGVVNVAAPRLSGIASAGRTRAPLVGDAETRAGIRVANAINDTGGAVSERQRLTDLGLQPSLMDVSGGTAERLVRTAAGPAGQGADAAVSNLTARQASLKPDVIRDVRALSPVDQSADDLAASLTGRRSALADEMYPEAYASRVQVTPEILSALSDEPGRAALRRARQAAVARQNTEQVAEIDSLLNAPPALADAPRPVGPYLVSGIRHNGRVYRGETHIDALASIEDPLERVRATADGNNRVFVTDSGRILNRQRAQQYAVENDLFKPDAPSWARTSPELISENIVTVAPPSRTSTALPQVSAGTLDRVRIAMQGRGAAMQQRPDTRDIAGGLFNRASQIDTALEGVPALGPARSTYRGISEQLDALDPRKALDIFEDPRDFSRRVQALSPQAREAALVRVTQDLTDTLGGQRNAGTGTIDTANQAPYARENLSALLGPDRAEQFLSTLQARVQQAQRAARVSPNTGSQTFGRLDDDATFQTAERLGAGLDVVQGARGNPMAIARTIDRLRARATMSEAERNEVVRLGLGSADELERVLMLADQARAQGRRLPREVRRFVERVETRLGAPTADAVLNVLQPTRSLAEEERQQP